MAEYTTKDLLVVLKLLELEFKGKCIQIKGASSDEIINRLAAIAEIVKNAPVKCGDCAHIMTPSCPMCSFDIDGYCTGGPDNDFYCGAGRHKQTSSRKDEENND